MDTKELTALTQSISDALGADWYVPEQEGGNWARKIQHKTMNATLYISGDGYNKPTKCTISGGLNVGPNGQYVEVHENVKRNDYTHWERVDPGSISVTIARGAAVIAKEINRRFLPEYFRILALANSQVVKENDYKKAKRANLVRLAAAAGKTLANDDREVFNLSAREAYGDVSTSEKTASITLHSLTIEQAEAILRLLTSNLS